MICNFSIELRRKVNGKKKQLHFGKILNTVLITVAAVAATLLEGLYLGIILERMLLF